jgi:ComF family protein
MRFLSLIQKTCDGVLDLVYPPRCLICEQYAQPAVCDSCYTSFTPISEPYCGICGRPVESGADCRQCREVEAAWGGWGFDAARAASVYEGALRHALHRLKYRGVEPLGNPLGAHLANRVVADELFNSAVLNTVAAVIPLPLLPAKERGRGFNQSALLAAPVAELLGVPLLTGAVRRTGKRHRAQVGLSGDARRVNVSPSHFHIPDPSTVAGKTLLLIDDVFTTGATVSACGRALKGAGAARVLVATLAAGG